MLNMKSHMKSLLGLVVAASLLTVLPAQSTEIIKLATTTSTENSGLLQDLLPKFESESGYKVQVIATGTGKALKLGEQGDVDLVMTHAPSAEAKFVADGFGVEPRGIMENDFVVLGPKTILQNCVKAKLPKKLLLKLQNPVYLLSLAVIIQALTLKS